MGSALGRHSIRIAVNDHQTNHRIVKILRDVLDEKHAPYAPVSVSAIAATAR
jgi:hypothetical protein